MTNGLGAGLFALTLLAILAGLAGLGILATITSVAFHRRTGHVPTLLRYLVVAIGVAVLGITGFVVLAMYDEAPVIAWLFAWIALLPLVALGAYLDRTTELSQLDVAVTTVMAWGLPFLLGVVVVFGTMTGITAAFDLTSFEARQLGVAWVASAVGGIAIALGMVLLGTRLGGLLRPEPVTQEGV